MNSLINRRLAVCGMLGGILYMISDLFIFLSRELIGVVPDAAWSPAWGGMGEWRFAVSAWIALLGSGLLFCGFVSLYEMVRETCGKLWRLFTLCGAAGVGGVLLAHTQIGVLPPLLYKAMARQGLSAEASRQTYENISAYLSPVSVLIILLFYTQLAVIIYGVLSGRFGLRRRVLLYMTGVTLVVTAVLALSLSLFGIRGGVGGGESLFEGMMYLIPFWYWNTARRCLNDGNAAGTERYGGSL